MRQRAAAPTRTEVLDALAEAPADALPAAPRGRSNSKTSRVENTSKYKW